MKGRIALGLLAACALAAGLRPGAHAAVPNQFPAGTPSALTILRNARAAFRDVKRPAYIEYTMDRQSRLDNFFDSDDSYTLHVWYRGSDGGALSRKMTPDAKGGALSYIHPRFDAPIDPGPPTADIFEPARTQAQLALPTPAPGESALRIIGSIWSTSNRNIAQRSATSTTKSTTFCSNPSAIPIAIVYARCGSISAPGA